MATIDIKKLENRMPTSLVKYAFMDQRSSNISAMASPGLGFMGGASFPNLVSPSCICHGDSAMGSPREFGGEGGCTSYRRDDYKQT